MWTVCASAALTTENDYCPHCSNDKMESREGNSQGHDMYGNVKAKQPESLPGPYPRSVCLENARHSGEGKSSLATCGPPPLQKPLSTNVKVNFVT